VTIADFALVQSMAASAAGFDGDAGATYAAFPTLLAYYKEFTAKPELNTYFASPMGQAAFNSPGARFSALVLPKKEQ
jgi:hypothetical protein